MKFLDLKKQYKQIASEINSAIKRVLNNGVFIGGEEVNNFEKEVAGFCNIKFALAVNSGTDAIFLSLKALGVQEGDEIITTPFTFIATAEAIANCGAKPVFVDIDPVTFNIDVDQIENKITKKTKVILPVHVFGQMVNMDKIMKLAHRYKLSVVEDAAQSFGSFYKGKLAGAVGRIGCYSFFPSKNLGAYGDGGMIVTDNKKIMEKIKLLKNHGSSSKDKYKNLILGINSRLDSIQAAILRVKLKHLNKWMEEKRKKAAVYNKELSAVKKIILPQVLINNKHTYHQYSIRVIEERNDLHNFLQQAGIPTMIYYSLPLHLQPAFKYLGYKKGDFPNSEMVSQEVLSLPLYPEFSQAEQKLVINKIKTFFKVI
ncbi:MAG: DegT/DnrJ/EryC1/StrS family aminotransferase [Candidatus Magasanikbacteria bacterium]|nr:DegT/DnrJ/EryC1/StrS family aminotransferase [Candidatus Magasanikbacteria bacterium]